MLRRVRDVSAFVGLMISVLYVASLLRVSREDEGYTPRLLLRP